MISILELLAVLSSGIYGVLLARRKQMDFVGVFSIAIATAFGGGTLRDLFLDRHPLFWIENHHYPTLVFMLALATSLLRAVPPWVEKWLLIPDALSLGLFSIAGVSVALNAECSLFIAALMGVITGTFGGVIGDIVCNEIPSLFRPGTPLYATCAFTGCWFYLGMHQFEFPEVVNLSSSVLLITLFRLTAVSLDWHLLKLE